MKKIGLLVGVLLLLGLSPGLLLAADGDTQAELGDLDNDGRIDAVLCIRQVPYELNSSAASSLKSNIKILMNDGTGLFEDETAERLAQSRYAASIKLEDIDADKDLDILGIRTTAIDCYLNDGLGKFTLKEVPQPPVPPIAKASAAPMVGPAPLKVQFSSAGSNDPDGGALTYLWDFGDGAASTEANPAHVYELPPDKPKFPIISGIDARYTAKLTVTDDEGQTGRASVAIVVRKTKPITIQPVNK